jgi:aldose 1-epimerase
MRLNHAGAVISNKSGIVMNIFYTQEPGLQFYTGNFMQGKLSAMAAKTILGEHFTMETQHFVVLQMNLLFRTQS